MCGSTNIVLCGGGIVAVAVIIAALLIARRRTWDRFDAATCATCRKRGGVECLLATDGHYTDKGYCPGWADRSRLCRFIWRLPWPWSW